LLEKQLQAATEADFAHKTPFLGFPLFSLVWRVFVGSVLLLGYSNF
jgi:hypothetical protein